LHDRCEFANTCTPEQAPDSRDRAYFLTWRLRPVYLAKEMFTRSNLTRLGARKVSRGVPVRARKRATLLEPLPILRSYYDALFREHGPQNWWPGRTRFEIIVGAILVQNTAWTNVERAIVNLRRERLLSPTAMERVPQAKLAGLIRSSGYFRQKARKLKEFVRFLRKEYGGSLDRMFRAPTAVLREQLLVVHGIGPETADSILLYAGGHPVFVVDAYTKRVLERHQLIHAKATYEGIRNLFEQSLPNSVSLFNEYHALIVHTGKHFCKSRVAHCSVCPLNPYLPAPRDSTQTSPLATPVDALPVLSSEVAQ
jgi:endonuclease-3 related protein